MARKEAQMEEILGKYSEGIKKDVQMQIMSLNSTLTDINTQLRDSPKVHFLCTIFGLAIGLIVSPIIDYSNPTVFWLTTVRNLFLGIAVIAIASAPLWICTNKRFSKKRKEEVKP
jgi:uncharacterized protein YacL